MHTRQLYHSKNNKHWGFTIEGDTVVIHYEKRVKCNNPVDAIAMAKTEIRIDLLDAMAEEANPEFQKQVKNTSQKR